MNKRKLTRSLMAACSIVALTTVMYGCVGGGDDAPATDVPDTSDMDTALGAAQMAASDAADAAGSAAGAAEAAVMAQAANEAADTGSYAVANNAAMRARAAANAAQSASDAAAATMDTAAAEAQQAIAEAKQTEAEAEQGNAVMYAGMVSDAHIEIMNLASAKMGAMTAAGLAEAAADAAEASERKVAELTGDDSGQSTMTNAAAMAAREAATAARAASDRAQMDETSAEADVEQMTAETQQGIAEGQQTVAMELEREAQVASDASGVQNEARDLTDAQEATQDAAGEVSTHYMAAKGKAEMARAQASAARAAANKAKAARTDYANADKYADMAEAAATRAGAALGRAEMANTDAQAANTAAMDAGTSDAAEAEQAKAEAANVIATEAHTGATGAGMAYMAARDNAAKAAEAGPVHVRGLLKAANATSETDTDARASRVAAVAEVIGTAADMAAGTATTVTATWPGDTVEDPETDADEAAEGTLDIVVSPGGTALMFRTAAVADDPVTESDESMPKTATKIDGLPGFMNGYEISDGGTHAIVFTNRMQGDDSTLVMPVQFSNRPVTDFSRIVRAAADTAIDPADLNQTATYDHDNNDDTPGLDATFACVGATTCTFRMEGGKIVGVVGDGKPVVSFTGDIDAVGAGQNADYLAFGFWLQEDSNESEAGAQPAFDAFFGGGPEFATVATLIGKATYTGAATGVYTEGSKVDYFKASATLMADFGKLGAENAEDDQLGSITGEINNIVAGGNSMSDVISLNIGDADNNITDQGAFAGNARMGTAMVVDDVASYTYNGTWQGQFYGPEAEDDAKGVDTLPPAAAGTFGVTGVDDMGTADDADDDVTRSYVGAFGAER